MRALGGLSPHCLLLASRGLRQGPALLQAGQEHPPSASTATAAENVEGGGEAEAELRVEYCVLCNYQPRFELLRSRVQAEFPQLPVREDTEDHRPGAFEVVLQRGGYATDLWSKLITGEPSNLEATEAVAELVIRDLRRHLPRAAQSQEEQ